MPTVYGFPRRSRLVHTFSGISADLRLLEPRVPPWQPARQQLRHHGLLHDLELVDDRLRLLDGLVHRRQDGGDLPLLAERREGPDRTKLSSGLMCTLGVVPDIRDATSRRCSSELKS